MSSAPSVEPVDDLPEKSISVNQLVAYNIAYFRKLRDLTQEELGKRLEEITGKKWSKATMSAVERSWDGPRVRSFDADDIMAFSQALGYPVSAFLLPPTEDSTTVVFSINNVGGAGYRRTGRLQPAGGAEQLLEQLFVPEYDRVEDEAFVERLGETFDFYYGGIPADALIQFRPDEHIDESVAEMEQVDKLKRQIATLRDVIGTLDRAAHKIEESGLQRGKSRKTDGGRMQ